MTRGASLCEGNSPIGWPEYIASVCSSVIVARYCIVRRYWAQFWKIAPLPPYMMSSCGCWATLGSRLFCIMAMMAAAWRLRAGYSSIGRAYISYEGRNRYMYMRPYSRSSSANSFARTEWCRSGKYLRAFFTASTFCSYVRISFRFGAWFTPVSYGLASGSSSGMPARISSWNGFIICRCCR